MPSRQLKTLISDRRPTIGSWITVGHPVVAEIMANAGFDWLTIDMEHSATTLDQAQQLVRVIDLAGVAPLIRVGENDPNTIKQAMDTGAHGVIVPMVNSRAQAEAAVAAVRYPPEGFRGVGLSRAQGYGFDFESYREWVKTSSVVIVQIEHIDAVKNLAEILSVPGVDGFIVGPYDLSGSLGFPGEFDRPEVEEALKEVRAVSAEINTVSGFHIIPPDPLEIEAKIDEGYKFIGFSLDTLFLGQCGGLLETARNNIKQ